MRGFSLVELSIVLVILGLLTGGILAGQNLIRAAELRAVSTQLDGYISAVHTFRDKYFAIPGDMTNATAFWGKDNTNCSAHSGTTASPGTCNGTGDGRISSSAGPSSDDYEFQRFWQHLALAGLIEGSYTGVAGGGGSEHMIAGENSPRGKVSSTGVAVGYIGSYAAGAFGHFAGDYGNVFWYGTAHSTGVPYLPAFSPEEMWNIDTKMDDGRPAYGRVRQYTSDFLPGCVTTDVEATAEYNVQNKSILCSVLLRNAF